MSKREQKFLQILIFALIASGLIFVLSLRTPAFTVGLFAIGAFTLFMLSIYSMRIYSAKLFKLCLIGWILVFLVFCVNIFLAFSGFGALVTDIEYLQYFIQQAGWWGRIIYIIFAALQVTFLPVPSSIVVAIGSVLFGLWTGYILSMIGIALGSMFAYALGRIFGMRIAIWIAGQETVEKYKKIATENLPIYVFMILVPLIFPNSLLSILAGITGMKFWKFASIITTAVPETTIQCSFL